MSPSATSRTPTRERRTHAERTAETSTLNATGTLLVSLDAMLDRKLTIDGSLLSTTRANGTLTTVILPFTAEMTRSIAK